MSVFIKSPKDKIICPNRNLPLKDASLEDIYGELAKRFETNELGVEVRDIYCDGTTTYSIHLYHGKFPKEKDNKVIKQTEEPCDDAISRRAVLDIVEDMHDLARSDVLSEAIKQLSELPSVTSQPKIGHWIVDGSVDCYLDKVRCHCSECGKKKEFSADYDHIKHKLSIRYQYSEFIENYCSNCGAKMEEESNKIEKICCNCIYNKESEPTIDNCATCCEQNNFTPKPKGE